MILKLLEGLTTVVLLAVVLILGWLLVAAYAPDAVRWLSTEAAVVIILVLLTAALLMVSGVALLHTRD
jgi:hypothetical protein